MIHRKLIFLGQEVHSFEWHPSNNPSQIIKSPIGRRQPLQNFRHAYYESRGYRIVMRANLGFFDMDNIHYLHMGLLARDNGLPPEGVPNNGYEMWLNRDGKLHAKQLNTVGVKGIGSNWAWATSLSYPLVKDGKKFLDPTVRGFNRVSKTERTAFGQKADGTLISVIAKGMNDDMTADLMLHLGCVTAVMGDGGGSTQMDVDGKRIWTHSNRALGTVLAVFAKPDQKVVFIDETKKSVPNPNSEPKNKPSNPIPPSKTVPKLIIDAGHGGKDSGGGSSLFWDSDGFYEKDMVLQISKYQYDRFKELGVPVELTRDKDIYLSSTERTNIVKKSGATYCISNHINAASVESARGVETIHSHLTKGELAKELFDEVVKEGMAARRVFTRKGSDGNDYYFMHRLTGNVTTVIIEYGFATNKIDAELIQNNWKRYAEAVVRGYCEFIGHPYKAPQDLLTKEEEKMVEELLKKIEELEKQLASSNKAILLLNKTIVDLKKTGMNQIDSFNKRIKNLEDLAKKLQ